MRNSYFSKTALVNSWTRLNESRIVSFLVDCRHNVLLVKTPICFRDQLYLCFTDVLTYISQSDIKMSDCLYGGLLSLLLTRNCVYASP